MQTVTIKQTELTKDAPNMVPYLAPSEKCLDMVYDPVQKVWCLPEEEVVTLH